MAVPDPVHVGGAVNVPVDEVLKVFNADSDGLDELDHVSGELAVAEGVEEIVKPFDFVKMIELVAATRDAVAARLNEAEPDHEPS